jgi:hypothetical protein
VEEPEDKQKYILKKEVNNFQKGEARCGWVFMSGTLQKVKA